jgi:hypothetical protein
MLNAAPLTEICEIVTSLFPVFVSVISCETGLSAATEPKLRLEGPTEIASFAAATSPVTGNAAVTAAVFVNTETDPLKAPAAFGVNCTVKVLLVPGFNSVDPENPLMLKPAPLAITPVTVSASSPVFESLNDSELCTPAIAEEKLMLDGVTSSRGSSTNEGALLAIGAATQPIKNGTLPAAVASITNSCQLTWCCAISANRPNSPRCFTLWSPGKANFHRKPAYEYVMAQR